MFRKKSVYRMAITVISAVVLIGCAKTEVSQEANVETEEQEAHAEGEMAETAEDTLQIQSETDSGTAATCYIIYPDTNIRWAIYSEGIYCYGATDTYGEPDFVDYMDDEGHSITPCGTKYEEGMPFSEGLACVYQDGKYGYIDKNGETVLPFVYDQASSFREGVAYFSRGDEYGLIDKEGNVVLELTDCDSISSFREGLAYFSVDGQYGYMDKNGRIIIEPVYNDAGYFYEGLAVVMKDGLGGVIGKDGTEILAPEYIGLSTEDTCIVAQKEDRFIFFDTAGNEVSSGPWDWVSRNNDIFYIYKDNKRGFADQYGKLILEPVYEEIRPIPEKELVMVQNEEKEYGILDYEGQTVVPFCYYDSVDYFVNGQAVVELDEKYGVLRYDGTLEMPIEYEQIKLFSNGSRAVWTGDTMELTDSQGDLILTGNCDYVQKMGDGYETVSFGVSGTKKFWDSQGNLIVEYNHYADRSSRYGVKNTYLLDGGTLLKSGEEDEESLEEVLLTNQITTRIGAFKNFIKSGSVSAYALGVPYTEDMDDMRYWKRYYKLYKMDREDSVILYFYAAPLYDSRESNSGLYTVRDGIAEQLIGAGECGGSAGGDTLCIWYDTKEGIWKPGTTGSEGGFGGSVSTQKIYKLKDGKAVLENSFQHYFQYASNYSEETLLKNAELFYDGEGEDNTYTKETILEARSVAEYDINEKQVSIEDYNAAKSRYRYYSPLQMN